MEIKATNLSQLKRELKPLEGKAIFKLTRVDSMKDGEFLRVLHKIGTKNIVFWDGKQKCYLDYPAANEIEIFKSGFRVKNCTFELLEVKP